MPCGVGVSVAYLVVGRLFVGFAAGVGLGVGPGAVGLDKGVGLSVVGAAVADVGSAVGDVGAAVGDVGAAVGDVGAAVGDVLGASLGLDVGDAVGGATQLSEVPEPQPLIRLPVHMPVTLALARARQCGRSSKRCKKNTDGRSSLLLMLGVTRPGLDTRCRGRSLSLCAKLAQLQVAANFVPGSTQTAITSCDDCGAPAQAARHAGPPFCVSGWSGPLFAPDLTRRAGQRQRLGHESDLQRAFCDDCGAPAQAARHAGSQPS